MTTLEEHNGMYYSKNPIIVWFHRKRAEKVAGLAKKYGGGKGRVLDVGCGIGYILSNIEGKLHGIDIEPGAIEEAMKKMGGKAEFLVGNADSLPYKDDFFDIVLCSEVLEHNVNPEPIVKELFRVAKPNAKVIITVPNELNLTMGRVLMLKWPPKVPDHRSEISISQLEKMAGRRQIELIYFPFGPEAASLFKIAVFSK